MNRNYLGLLALAALAAVADFLWGSQGAVPLLVAGIAGLRGTGLANWATDERPKNFREMILWRDPNGVAPMTALMSKMASESVDDPEFNWYEEELAPIRLRVSAAATTSEAALAISTLGTFDALDVVAGDILLVEELEGTTYGFEVVEVSANPTASNSVAITRGAAGTAANTGTIASSTWLLKIGSAFEEGATSPKASSRKPTKLNNLCQIFKTSYNLTNTALETRFRTGDPLKNDKKRKMFDHSQALEFAFMFGFKHETTGTDGQPKRYTGGLYKFLADHYNATDTPTIKIFTTTTITEQEILDATFKMFDYGHTGAGNERIGLCGNGFLNQLNKIVLGSSSTRINYDKTVDYFGMHLERWRLPQGTLYLRTHPLMNVHSRFTNGAFFINPAAIKYRYVKNRDTKFQDNIQANDADQRKGQWIGECGAEWHHLRSMMYLALGQS